MAEPYEYSNIDKSDYIDPIIAQDPNEMRTIYHDVDTNNWDTSKGYLPSYFRYESTVPKYIVEKGNLRPQDKIAGMYDRTAKFFNKHPKWTLAVDDYRTGLTDYITKANSDKYNGYDPNFRFWYKVNGKNDTAFNHAFNPANTDPYGLLRPPTQLPRYDFTNPKDINRALANYEYINDAMKDWKGYLDSQNVTYVTNPKTGELYKDPKTGKPYTEKPEEAVGLLALYNDYNKNTGWGLNSRDLRRDNRNFRKLYNKYKGDLGAILEDDRWKNKVSDTGKRALGQLVGYHGTSGLTPEENARLIKADFLRQANAAKIAKDWDSKYFTHNSNAPQKMFSVHEPGGETLDEYIENSIPFLQLADRSNIKARGGSMPTQQKKPSPEWIKNQYGIMTHIAPGYSNDEWDVYI